MASVFGSATLSPRSPMRCTVSSVATAALLSTSSSSFPRTATSEPPTTTCTTAWCASAAGSTRTSWRPPWPRSSTRRRRRYADSSLTTGASHHHLHDCLVRFRGWLDQNQLAPAVAEVVNKETQESMRGRSAKQMAEEFFAGPAQQSQAAALWGARALCRLQPERTAQALQLATRLDHPDLSIQGCVEVLESLREGDFGSCLAETEAYMLACSARFPHAIAFKPPQPEEPNHVADARAPKEQNN
ncbi:N-alpha-acetyltransferase 15, NatA auxiliary subunit-like [Cydia fagiglandana]|uniref:N-alpha-acetyltransferase 15, NatA auxiliary subunit-like n=1 Tax=Cydia fagiglandana TaxID=1458189 RepID=UPI002FEE4167